LRCRNVLPSESKNPNSGLSLSGRRAGVRNSTGGSLRNVMEYRGEGLLERNNGATRTALVPRTLRSHQRCGAEPRPILPARRRNNAAYSAASALANGGIRYVISALRAPKMVRCGRSRSPRSPQLCQLQSYPRQIEKEPGDRGATGQSGRKMPNVGLGRRRDKQWMPDAHPLRQQEGPAACRRIQWVKSHPIRMPKASQTTAVTRTANTSVQPPKS
jgi:hypothetical protein